MLKSRRQKQTKPTRIFLVCDEPSCLLKIWSLANHQLLTVHSRFSRNFKTMSITDALRLQMEVQKRLRKQLEIQRNLKLQIEEQVKYLQQMFEPQRKMENNKSKTSSSNVDDPSASLSKSEQNSPKNEKSVATEEDLAKTGAGTGQANTAQQESSPSSSKKQKAPQTEAAEDDDSGHTNAKRARTSETSEPSAKSPSD